MVIIYEKENLIAIFNDISPFNMNTSMNNIEKKKLDKTVILQDVEATIHLNNFKILCGNKNSNVMLVKLRIQDESINKGKRSGFRVIAILDKLNKILLILCIYSKTGSKRSDNLSKPELKKAQELFAEYKKEIYRC